jgi:hypothetical protein
MGKSERKTINSKLKRKDKGSTSNGENRFGQPNRSERKWWKKGYTGNYYPDYYPQNPVLENHVEKCKEANR